MGMAGFAYAGDGPTVLSDAQMDTMVAGVANPLGDVPTNFDDVELDISRGDGLSQDSGDILPNNASAACGKSRNNGADIGSC